MCIAQPSRQHILSSHLPAAAAAPSGVPHCCSPHAPSPFPPACRYNLKRKIAGLPPVTREWYEARKAQLLATSSAPVQRVWFDPLCKRKFYTENTYQTFIRCASACLSGWSSGAGQRGAAERAVARPALPCQRLSAVPAQPSLEQPLLKTCHPSHHGPCRSAGLKSIKTL